MRNRLFLLSALVVFVSGVAAAYTEATLSPILGLMERITIGGFLQWLFGLEAVRCSPARGSGSAGTALNRRNRNAAGTGVGAHWSF